MICAPHIEIEMWIIDSKGKIIYNHVIVTQSNNGCRPLDTDYCRYYLLHQRHLTTSISKL